jgi:hypothetical protein
MGYRQIMTHEDVFETIVRPHGLTFDPTPAKSLIASRTESDGLTKVDVISSEILSGNPYFGGRESDQYATRLHQLAPQALILISIREQVSLMTSIYMQYLGRGGTMRPDDFFANRPTVGYFSFSPEHLEFHRLIGLYRELYGSSKVIVITKEGLDQQPMGVAKRIAAFCGNDSELDLGLLDVKRIGVSYPEYISFLVRRLNYFRRGVVNPTPLLNLGAISRLLLRGTGALASSKVAARSLGHSKPVTSLVAKRFRGTFGRSNALLKEMLGDHIDLTGYEQI